MSVFSSALRGGGGVTSNNRSLFSLVWYVPPVNFDTLCHCIDYRYIAPPSPSLVMPCDVS